MIRLFSNLVRHETRCDNPFAAFRDLREAAGLAYGRRVEEYLEESTESHDDALYSLNRISAHQPDKWKSELTSTQIKTVASVISRFNLSDYPDFA